MLREIEAFMRENDIPAATFGRLFMKDPRFVMDLRMGRQMQARKEAELRAKMAGYRIAQARLTVEV